MFNADLIFAIETVCVAFSVLAVFKLLVFLLYVRNIKRVYKDVPGPKEKHWLFGTFPTNKSRFTAVLLSWVCYAWAGWGVTTCNKRPNSCYFCGLLVQLPEDSHDRCNSIVDMCNKYGRESGYVVMWGMLWKPFIVCCSPRVMGNICKTSEPKPLGFLGVYKMLLPWLGEGLLVANGEKWARNRRLLTPAFHFDILKPYVNVYNNCANILMSKLSSHAVSGKRLEVFENVSLCTLEVILKCAFSYDQDVQNVGENPYVRAVNRITDTLLHRFLRPYLQIDFIWYMTKRGKQFKKDCDYVHSVAENVIQKRRETLEGTVQKEERKYVDFLDILLTARDENGKGLTHLEIRNEVDTFLFEGHDTTASAISWILYSLAENIECQKKCQSEIDDILDGRENDDIQWSDLSRLEYLTMCIKEGMRLHSPVPIVSRVATKDFDTGDRILPKGAIVQLNIWALNHMENIWPNHMAFIPERFTKENVAAMEAYQFVPFSAGARNCIGQHFAMHEEKVILSKLLRNFTFTLDTNHAVRRKISATMRTESGMYMFVKKRTH